MELEPQCKMVVPDAADCHLGTFGFSHDAISVTPKASVWTVHYKNGICTD